MLPVRLKARMRQMVERTKMWRERVVESFRQRFRGLGLSLESLYELSCMQNVGESQSLTAIYLPSSVDNVVARAVSVHRKRKWPTTEG